MTLLMNNVITHKRGNDVITSQLTAEIQEETENAWFDYWIEGKIYIIFIEEENTITENDYLIDSNWKRYTVSNVENLWDENYEIIAWSL